MTNVGNDNSPMKSFDILTSQQPSESSSTKKTESTFTASKPEDVNKGLSISVPDYLNEWTNSESLAVEENDLVTAVPENISEDASQSNPNPSKIDSEADIQARMTKIQDRLKALKEARKELKKDFKNVEKGKADNLSYDKLIERRDIYNKEYNDLKNEWQQAMSSHRMSDLKIPLKKDKSNSVLKKQQEAVLKTDKKAVEFFNKEKVKKASIGKRIITQIAKLVFRGSISKAKQESLEPKKDYSKITETLDGMYMKGEYGTQTIERYDIVIKDMSLYQSSIEELTKKKELLQIELQSKNGEIENQISKIDKSIQQWEQKSSGYDATVNMKERLWIGSNYFRDLIKEHGYDEAVRLYTAIPVNMRYQSWSPSENEIGDAKAAAKPQEIGFIRLGVISDLRNGFTNLSELKELAEKTPTERNQFLDQKIVKLKSMMAKLDPTKEKDANKIDALKRAIAQFEGAKNENYLNEMIAGRRVALRDQFAHLVNEQVNLHGAEPDQAFKMAHIALLDEKKKKLDATGWMHSEVNEMQDMEEIFKEYNGKEITFSDSFHIDENGDIHLPRPKGIPEEQQSIKLETIFFNVSVGGGAMSRLKKRTHQPEVLKRSMDKLGSSVGNEQVGTYFKLKARMEKGESTHETAEDLAFLLHDCKVPFSIGCLSAKDRTKLVGESVIRRHAVKVTKDTRLLKAKPFSELTGEKEQIEMEAKKAEKKLLNDAWTNPENASSQVLQDTTGSTVAKLGPHLMTHISTGAKYEFTKQALFAHQVKPMITGQKSAD